MSQLWEVKTADVVMMMMIMTAMVLMGVVAVFHYSSSSFALKHGSPREKKITTSNMKNISSNKLSF